MAKAKRKGTRVNGKPRKHRSAFLPGMEPPSHKDVDAAAQRYYEAKTARMELSKQESEAKAILGTVMKTHDLTTYTTPDMLECHREFDEAVTCRRKKAKKAETADA